METCQIDTVKTNVISPVLPNLVMITIFSHLPAEVLYHHVALLNKKTRAGIPAWDLLD